MGYSNTGILEAMSPNFFPEMRRDLGRFLVDKTKLIEHIVVRLTGRVDLVLRPRRCGKSTMLQMLKSFFSIPRNGDIDPRLLFAGLHIMSKEDICTEHMGKYPVIFCDFKGLSGMSWEGMLSKFRTLVSSLYEEWQVYLMQSLTPPAKTYFESILNKTATEDDLTDSLYQLSSFLTKKFRQKVIVLIDEYEVPNHCAYELGYFNEANRFFGHGVLPSLLKSNRNLAYAVLVGVTPTSKSGWYSNVNTHALHTHGSPFAGMLMFTEPEVIRLRTLAESELLLADLEAHYSSYIAAGQISVYNPVSIMSALSQSEIENFWVATGEFPLLNRQFPDDGLHLVEDLMAGAEIEFDLEDDVTYSSLSLGTNATLNLLYYAGYLTMTTHGQFKIPNREVMADWVRWTIGEGLNLRIFSRRAWRGPVSDFTMKWPDFMQQGAR